MCGRRPSMVLNNNHLEFYIIVFIIIVPAKDMNLIFYR